MRDVPPGIKPVIIEFIDDDTPIESLHASGADEVDVGDADRWLAQIHEALYPGDSVPGESGAELKAGSLPRGEVPAAMGGVDVLSVDLRFRCPHCSQRLQVDVRSAREMFQCPRCASSMRIPSVTRALRALSQNDTERQRSNCQRMVDEFREFDPADASDSWGSAGEPLGRILSIEVRLCCVVCQQTSQIDARSHGVAADCPGCNTPLRVPDWRDLLTALFARGSSTEDARPFSPLTTEEREFLGAPFAQPRTGWLSRK